jgi:hypothetical protein
MIRKIDKYFRVLVSLPFLLASLPLMFFSYVLLNIAHFVSPEELESPDIKFSIRRKI